MHLRQPPIRALGRPERDGALGGGRARAVGVPQPRPARAEPREDRRLLPRDAGNPVRERLQVDRPDIRHQRDVGRGKGGQRRDLAGMVHPDLDHAERGVAGQLRQGQRHAPVIVEALHRGVDAPLPAQHVGQHLLGRRLAHAARHRDDARARPRPPRAGPAPPARPARPRRPGTARDPRPPAPATPAPPRPRPPARRRRSRARPAPPSAPRRGPRPERCGCRWTGP